MKPDRTTTPRPPFSREQFLTVREFELFCVAQAKLEDERQQRVTLKFCAIEEKMEERFLSGDKALALAGQETKVHLQALNGEQARLAADRERFVSRESYEVSQKEFGLWRDQVNAALHIEAGRDRGIGLSWGVVIGLIGVATAIASIILAFIRTSP